MNLRKLSFAIILLALTGIFLFKANSNSQAHKERGNERSVAHIEQSYTGNIGSIPLKQPLPKVDRNHIDPFLLLHHLGPHSFDVNNEGLPFGPHPHVGFETVTFIFSGDVVHRDSEGYISTIKSGGIQWMNAGSGIVHSERSSPKFMRDGGELEVMQLWINLPAKDKTSKPIYQGFNKEDIPVLSLDGGKITLKLVSGTWSAKEGAAKSVYPVNLAIAKIKEGAVYNWQVKKEKNILLYVQKGSIKTGGREASTGQMVEFNNDGDLISIEAKSNAHLILGSAHPINEPVVIQGPFVMNTREEIEQARRDYEAGKFGVLEE